VGFYPTHGNIILELYQSQLASNLVDELFVAPSFDRVVGNETDTGLAVGEDV